MCSTSLNLDLWTKEMVDVMRSIGNTKSNDLYNPRKVPPPPDVDDSREMGNYVRKKYEAKAFASSSSSSSATQRGSSRLNGVSKNLPPLPPSSPPQRQSSFNSSSAVPASPPLPRRPTISLVDASPVQSFSKLNNLSLPQQASSSTTPLHSPVWDEMMALSANSPVPMPAHYSSTSYFQAPAPPSPSFVIAQQQGVQYPMMSSPSLMQQQQQQQPLTPQLQYSSQQPSPTINSNNPFALMGQGQQVPSPSFHPSNPFFNPASQGQMQQMPPNQAYQQQPPQQQYFQY